MAPLSPDAVRLVELARSTDHPKPSDEARIRGALRQRMVLATAGTAAGLGITKLAAGIGLGKLVVVVGLGSAAAGGLYATYRQVREPGMTPSSSVSRPRSGTEPSSVVTTSQPEEEHRTDQPTEEATTVASAEPPKAPLANPRTSVGKASVDPAPLPAPDQLKAETAALREAQQALRMGEPDLALSLISKQNHRFSDGILQQERAAARIMALCQLGRATEGSAEVTRFALRWPKSPLLARVKNACGPSEQ